MTPAAGAGGPPPVPHVEVKKDLVVAAPPPPVAMRKRRPKRGALIGLAVGLVLVLGAGGFLVWRQFLATPEPAPAAPRPKAPAPAPATAATPAQAGPTPSATLNAAAQAPGQAIDKTKSVVGAQAAGARATDEIVASDAPATPAPAPARRAPPSQTTAVTELAPGVSATSQVDAAPDASPAFRTFVANLRISGVVGGNSPRAFINGRVFRAGETIDSALGVQFDGVRDGNVVFKDRSGATVLKRY